MIIHRVGQVCEGFHVLGSVGVPSFLVDAERPLVVEIEPAPEQ